MERVDMLFLGQPNNPNGVQYPVETLHRLARKAEITGTILVVDEAFMDFIPESQRQSLAPRLKEYPQVIIIRSMTKFYAIPGLRLGYALGRPELIHAMTEKQVTWSVNGLALIAGEACLQSGENFEQETMALVSYERERLTTGLEALGCERGILIRSCAMYLGLGERHVRFAVKDAEANGRLLETMENVMEPDTTTGLKAGGQNDGTAIL
ncbi:hypothetical protein G195_001082 [Phytophthora kernoviae 00238/432]|uniref:histidinol-phosphate transaminase n=1 Tax=Phytophthora kernoviae 00238/432 TaxID=1284355 RepID=A0A8J4WB27_9STRA|nr:hypothetical protein G195_001082 [Phytophthora kernoviae 00238/432]